MSPNWLRPEGCHETARYGGFFASVKTARRHFLRQNWKIIDDDWFCPVCAKELSKRG